jgi:hypothetical protein
MGERHRGPPDRAETSQEKYATRWTELRWFAGILDESGLSILFLALLADCLNYRYIINDPGGPFQWPPTGEDFPSAFPPHMAG